MDVDNKLEYNKELLDENANKLYVDIQNNNNEVELKIIKECKEIMNEMKDMFNTEMEKKQQEVNKLNKTVDKLQADVIVLQNSDPNSKNLQKIIKKLTDKISIIDKHFKFTNNSV